MFLQQDTSNNPLTPQTTELEIPEMEKPEKTHYKCDVLVVGCGWAGLNAAYSARQSGASVLVVDKGTPGYSGLSAFSSSHQWFDPEMGDDLDACIEEMTLANEYIANIDWFRKWASYSKETYQRLMSWGILTQYPTGEDSGHYVDGDWAHDDLYGYHREFQNYDRRKRWIEVLEENDIQYVTHTMLYDIFEKDRKVTGAIGFHVPTATVITFEAKAIVMCTGGGSFKPSGFPTSCDTFDGDWIGYQHGLPIVGKEFDDFHFCASFAPGNVLSCNSWQYLENIWLTGGDMTKDNIVTRAQRVSKSLIIPRLGSALNGLPPYHRTDVVSPGGRGVSATGRPDDPRKGKWTSPVVKGDAYGAAVGMQLHLGCGIFCGIDDLEGKTAIDGLWVAGDGANGSMVSGGSYLASTGFTSNFCSVQGYIAGEAAGNYACGASEEALSPEEVQHVSDELLAPLNNGKGFDPNWVVNQLQAIMSPYWVTIIKTEDSLKNTLALVEQLRDEVVPKLVARNPHELRLCHEAQHKVLCAEMKLRASMERKESRGYHYRADYPYRNDDYLCYFTITKTDDGMRFDKVDVKDSWKGDTSLDYEKRYASFHFPGECEAKGIQETEEKKSGSYNR